MTALKSGRITRRDPLQPRLLFDPMPGRIQPALALLIHKPPVGGSWGWEIKWDGYRLHVHIEANRVRILTRGGFDWTNRFPAIAEAARTFAPTSMILDGEAVVVDEEGRSDFSLLQKSLGASGRKIGNQPSPALLYAFDLLYLDGHDMRHVEYRTRRHLLEETLRGHEGAILLSEELDADPTHLLDHACRMGLEGIVGKRQDSFYRSGRTGDWIKLKCTQSDAFMVVGYEPSTASRAGFGALMLGALSDGELVYVGSVGTGFKERDAVQLRKTMDKIPWRHKQPPVPYSSKRKVVWVQPTLIAEIEYSAWTADEKLRHPSFKGLREFQDNADVCRLRGRRA
ncbi:non-homologous end-joining DNA ligase [Ensifer adhaerens]